MRKAHHQGLIVGLAVSTVSILAAAAVMFAHAQGTASVARQSAVQLRAEAVLGAASSTRTQIGQVLILAEAQRAGLVSEEQLDEAISDARGALERLSLRLDSLQAALTQPLQELEDIRVELLGSADMILELAQEGSTDRAWAVVSSRFDPSYQALEARVAMERDARETEIAAARQSQGRVVSAARFLVAFVVPGIALLAFRSMVRRQQQQAELEARLARERELGLAKDEFLASVSHEMRTPLTAVLGFTELLREGRHDFDEEERDELIDLIAAQAQDSTHIIEDLLVAARADLGQLTIQAEDFDIRQALESLTQGWQVEERDHLTLTGSATVRADPVRTRQILRNLLTNALRYGGDRVEVRVRESGAMARVEVADDGGGIPEADRQRIFEPYYRAHRPGTEPASVGLGLTVSRRLARLMGGELTYRQEDGESVFALELPASAGEALEGAPIAAISARPSRASIESFLEEGPTIVFQPVVDLASARTSVPRIIGWEALSRFAGELPKEWFETASEVGLRLDLEIAAIRKAADEFTRHHREGFLAVNVSDRTLTSPRLVEALEKIDPDRVVLELSEEAAGRRYRSVQEAVAALVELEYRLCIDDVGSGELDLWQVLRLEPALIKLDISLTRNLDQSGQHRALVRGLAAVAEDLDAGVVAEGIERSSQVEVLLGLGVRYGQGFYLGAPQEAQDFERDHWLGLTASR
jgi:signal transduction histidine kinase/EAL domain-containing protein (putative c-di-GMP-specific phosphodiesterase class I)